MITITLQPRTPAHLDAALALLQRIRDDEAAADAKFSALFRGVANDTMADTMADAPAVPEPGADEEEPATVEPAKVIRKRKNPPLEAAAAADPGSPSTSTAVTLVDLRAKLATLSRNGHADAVKALLTDFGAAKLTDLSEADYPALMDRAEGIA